VRRDLLLVVLLASAATLLAQNDRSDPAPIADGGLGTAPRRVASMAGDRGTNAPTCIAAMLDYEECIASQQAGQSVFLEDPGWAPRSRLDRLFDGLLLFQDLTSPFLQPRPLIAVFEIVPAATPYARPAVGPGPGIQVAETPRSSQAVFKAKHPSSAPNAAMPPGIGAGLHPAAPTAASVAPQQQPAPNGLSAFRRRPSSADNAVPGGSMSVSSAPSNTAVFRRTSQAPPAERGNAESFSATPTRSPAGTAAFRRTSPAPAGSGVGEVPTTHSGNPSSASGRTNRVEPVPPIQTYQPGNTATRQPSRTAPPVQASQPTKAPPPQRPVSVPKPVVIRVPPPPVVVHR
jgi:hypothetical protein